MISSAGGPASRRSRAAGTGRGGGEVLAAVNLQKSQYGPQYYLNQGFWLRQLGDERYPKVTQWHVLARLEDLLPAAEARIGELLDLGCQMPDEQRVAELVMLLEERLLPLIERGSSVAGLPAMLEDGIFAGAAIRGPAQGVLAEVR